ncbi:MAG: DUF72 domain-containing protein [Myxococcales bacterium]
MSRPSHWGNPFSEALANAAPAGKPTLRAESVVRFRRALEMGDGSLPFTMEQVRQELRGKNLACWCPLDQPCHADVLLEVANKGTRAIETGLLLPSDSNLFVGTAGWSIPKELRDRFRDRGSILSSYGGVLNAVEINSTFYRRHRLSTFERWRESVPSGFRFAVKLPRTITHFAALAGCEEDLTAFFDDVRGLGEKLGPVLVQLPASVHFERRRVQRFLVQLRKRYSGPVACEPRHASWYGPAASALFIEHAVARVIADPPRPVQAAEPLVSASLLYVRWHGSPRLYWSAYSDEQLTRLAKLAMHQSTHTSVWIVFDNTAAGAALDDALRFKRALSAPRG